MTIKAYLQFGGAGTVDTFGPRQTIGVELVESRQWQE
jgi:hypothetical protein